MRVPFDNRWNQHTYTSLTLLPFGLWTPGKCSLQVQPTPQSEIASYTYGVAYDQDDCSYSTSSLLVIFTLCSYMKCVRLLTDIVFHVGRNEEPLKL